ncbi:hypothetical protein E2C01_100607 [Portunus trituberculatus]|uniref:Uncharacterized protein n=1 Tax=Portunus trituberculatus TaxID=210409 RepID=A0A5B7KDH0_PORTR|nr:hypothetical protein [Portunus trituberculatus]
MERVADISQVCRVTTGGLVYVSGRRCGGCNPPGESRCGTRRILHLVEVSGYPAHSGRWRWLARHQIGSGGTVWVQVKDEWIDR